LAGTLVAAVSEAHNQARLAELVAPLSTMAEAEAFQRLPVAPADGAIAAAHAASAPVGMIGCPPPKR
jgi:hypothetical protein